MGNDTRTNEQWAEHMPSEGENMENAERNRTRQGVDATAGQHQAEASAAPSEADPGAAENNREFVEDVAMRYDSAEEQNARKDAGS